VAHAPLGINWREPRRTHIRLPTSPHCRSLVSEGLSKELIMSQTVDIQSGSAMEKED
jgi:hypothetical protein